MAEFAFGIGEAMAKNTLGLGGDGDDVEFVEAIAAAFGIKFDKEPEAWTTFGDVFDAICRHMQPVERGALPCLSASAYRRIRRAIVAIRPGSDVELDTPLENLIGGGSVPTWWRDLERESRLKLPALRLTNWSGLFLIVHYFAIPIAVVVSGWPGWVALLSPVLAICAGRWLPVRPPVRTVRDLAGTVAAMNAKMLSRSHGAIRTHEVWDSLVWIARDISGRSGPIERETTLLA